MVNLVDVLVEWTPMHSTVIPVMPGILQDKKDGDLQADRLPAWERNSRVHPEVFCHWVEEIDLREFDGEVAEEDEFRACPLLGGGGDLALLDLVLVEIGDVSDNDPGETATEINDLVHDEAHDSGGQDIILHVEVPTL